MQNDKGLILDKLIQVTGNHRKAAVRLLRKIVCRGGISDEVDSGINRKDDKSVKHFDGKQVII